MGKSKKDDEEDIDAYNFNQGRKCCDSKWSDAIDRRIEELEKQVGIPELRRLKKKIRYTWDMVEEEKKHGKWIKKPDDEKVE